MTDTDMSARTAAADLALIRDMMEAGKRRAGIDGTHFVLWGVILMVSFFAQYLSVHHYLPPTILGIWVPAMVIGWGAEFWLGYRTPRPRGGSNIALAAYNTAWLSVGLTVLVYFGVSMAAGTFEPKTISLLSSGVIAAAFLVTAAVTGVRWLRFVALGWLGLLAYITLTLVFDAEMLLVMAAASALLILLPGQLMKRLAATDTQDTGAQDHA